MTNKIIDVLENNDFRICGTDLQDDAYFVELETYSPEGEDVIITMWYDGTDIGFIEAFRECAEDFDADEHAEMWISHRGTNGVPNSVRALIDDADAIKAMLLDMSGKLDVLC